MSVNVCIVIRKKQPERFKMTLAFAVLEPILLMYYIIKVWNGIQATPQGRRIARAGAGFERAMP